MRDEMGMPLPVEIASKEAKYDAAPELLQPGQWVCLNIDISCPWPVRPQSLEFDGHRIWIIPLTLEEYPGVAIQRSLGMTQDDAEELLYRSLSVLAWQHGYGITVIYTTAGGLPRMMGLNKKHGFSIRDTFDFTEIISPDEEKSRIALALMREGRSLNHHGYAFLSFWRVLELAYPIAHERVAWMTATLPTLMGHNIKNALESIAAAGIQDVAHHLFKSGRCAVAHATGKPIVNPDSPRDARRLYSELPLVQELAIRAIEERFDILTWQNEYDKHLYELRGWKEIFGSNLIARLLNGESPQSSEKVDLPDIHVRLRESPRYKPMEGMTATSLMLQDKKVHLIFQSSDKLFEFHFALDFGEERLHFDVTQGLFLRDDNSVRAAENLKEAQRFIRDYYLNGELQIWNSLTNVLLSRKDAFIPVNCYVDLDSCNARIAAAQAEIDKRRAANNEEE